MGSSCTDDDCDVVDQDTKLGSRHSFRVEGVPSLSTVSSTHSETMMAAFKASEEPEEPRPEEESSLLRQQQQQLLQPKFICIKGNKGMHGKSGLQTSHSEERKAAAAGAANQAYPLHH